MSGFNRVTSFILGLIVVVVFLFVFGSRVNVTEQLIAFKGVKTTPTLAQATPTPKAVVKVTPLPTSGQATPKKAGFFESLFSRKATSTPTPKATSPQQATGQTGQVAGSSTGSSVKGVSQIPNTGAPAILLPALLSSLGLGFFLRKKN